MLKKDLELLPVRACVQLILWEHNLKYMLCFWIQQCKQCNEQKNHSDFYRNKVMSDGLYSICKKCYLAKAATRGTERQVVHVKFCRRCNQEHPASEFYNSKMTIDGLQSYCKVITSRFVWKAVKAK